MEHSPKTDTGITGNQFDADSCTDPQTEQPI